MNTRTYIGGSHDLPGHQGQGASEDCRSAATDDRFVGGTNRRQGRLLGAS